MPSPAAKHAIVVGGGPAGLMAADVLSQAGVSVTIYDRMPSLARKFLMAGRGGLNITHSEALEAFLRRYREAEPRLAPLIGAFGPDDMRAFCAELGEETFVGSSGRIFPESFKTSPLLRAWLHRLYERGVAVRTRHRFEGWDETGALRFATGAGDVVLARADATILAVGGASWPRLGSDGGWTHVLETRGVATAPLRPANCGFIANWPADIGKRFAGTALKSIAISFGGQTRQGECIVTARGLEGGLIYAFSAELREAIEAHGSTTLHIDLKPAVDAATLTQRLAAAPAKQSLSNRLRKAARLSPAAIALLRTQALPADPAGLAARIKQLPIVLNAVASLERAISTAGGVRFEALNDHLMLKALPGVFAAGEMLDWEAPTGGYLLQACMATGKAAGDGALRWLGLETSRAD